MNKREIPNKNYIKLGAVIIATIALTFYWASWYNTTKEYRMNNSVIPTVIGEVTMEELDNYLLENPDIIIYIASSKDNTIKDFEDDLKKILVKEDLKNEFIYIDTSKIENQEFYQSFAQKYYSKSLKSKKDSLDIIPNIVLIEDGTVKDVMYLYKKDIIKEDVKKFIKKYGVNE